MAAYLTCWWIRYAGVLRGLPRLPLVVWAGFDAGLCDTTALVDRAGERLGFADLLAGLDCSWTALDVRPDLAGERLTLLDAETSACSDAGEDWKPIRRLSVVTIRPSITCPQQA